MVHLVGLVFASWITRGLTTTESTSSFQIQVSGGLSLLQLEAKVSGTRTDKNSRSIDRNSEVDVSPVCPAVMPGDTRILLLGVVENHHSSTAAMQVLMSSDKVTTLCSAGQTVLAFQAECEARFILNNCYQPGDCDAGTGIKSWPSDTLSQFSEYWDLDKPVLLDKGPLTTRVEAYTTALREGMEDLPMSMVDAGIQTVKLAYYILWRPICMSTLSSKALTTIERDGANSYAMTELELLEVYVEQYKNITNAGDPILVVNLADMIWRPEKTQTRLETYLPCAGDLDFNYIPEMGKDVFPANDYKVEDSIIDYGASIDPESIGYDIDSMHCQEDEDMFSDLDAASLARARSAEASLRQLS